MWNSGGIIQPTLENNTKTHYPFLQVNVICCLCVEVFEDPVHDDVITQVEVGVEKLSESFSGDLTGVTPVILIDRI